MVGALMGLILVQKLDLVKAVYPDEKEKIDQGESGDKSNNTDKDKENIAQELAINSD